MSLGRLLGSWRLGVACGSSQLTDVGERCVLLANAVGEVNFWVIKPFAEAERGEGTGTIARCAPFLLDASRCGVQGGRLRSIDGGRMVFLHGSVQSLTAGKGGQISIFEWRGGRVAEGGGLLNRYTV